MAYKTIYTQPEVIAHRGYPARYPENTLVGIEGALAAGTRYVEFDVQLTADGVPVLCHDDDMARTSGTDGVVTELSLVQLRTLDVGEAARLGDRFRGTMVSTLAEVAGFLAEWPAVTVFVEIKPHSIDRFGPTTTMDRVWAALGQPRPRYVITSSDTDVLAEARHHGAASVAWVLEDLSKTTRVTAGRLAPQYLLCHRDLLPKTADLLWAGPWRWAVYGVETAEDALELAGRGAQLIATDFVAEILPLLPVRGEEPHVA